MLFHAGDGNGRGAVIRRQKGGIQIGAVPLVMKIANIDAGFHGQRDAFTLFYFEIRIGIRCPCGMSPEAGIRTDLKPHVFRVAVVVSHRAVNTHTLFDIVDGNGPDILRQGLGTAIQIPVPTAVQLANIHAGFCGQRGASADRHGNALIIRSGSCCTGPQPGIKGEIELYRLVVSKVVVNIAPDCHALVHVFKRECLAIVVRI